MSFIDGLSSGLDTSAIISQLMQIERQPQQRLSSRRSQEERAQTELSEIRSDINAIRNTAADLRLSSGWDQVTAASSNEEAVSVTPTSSQQTGSYQFRVTSLATAASQYSSQVYASTDAQVAVGGASVFTASGYENLGFSNLTGSGLNTGDVNFSVTQSSEFATVQGVGIPAIPIEIDATNDDVELEVNGFHFSVSLTHGPYDSEQALAAALGDAIAANPDAASRVNASLTATNQISLSTLSQGSSQTLSVVGGDGLAALGLSAGSVASGVDAIVDVDGTETTLSTITAGAQVSLASGNGGTIEATLTGDAITSGTATVSQTGFGSGSLADVVNTINNADLSYTAAAVSTGDGYRLQLTAKTTGADSAFTPDPAVFGATEFLTLSAGTDAQLTVEGDNPFTISSTTNSFDNLVPGASITVKSLTDEPVTVSTERDIESVTGAVSELVDSINGVLGRIDTATSTTPGGPRAVLQGYRSARTAASTLRNAVIGAVGDSAVGSYGIELTRDGTLQMNAEDFKQALLENPDALADMFSDRAGSGELGILDRLVEVSEAAASSGSGYLFTAAQAAERRIDDYGRQIDDYERRIEGREIALRRTFANLEVSLGGLNQQSGYLAAQLGSLGG